MLIKHFGSNPQTNELNDGCKFPSNESKEWSGAREDFKKKCIKLENCIERIIKCHRQTDQEEPEQQVRESEKIYRNVQKQVKKIKEWFDDNDDKTDHKGTSTKSNITDNESAKIKTSNGVTMVDNKHQI